MRKENIYFDFTNRQYFTYITVDWQHIFLGMHDSYADAKKAYEEAESKYKKTIYKGCTRYTR